MWWHILGHLVHECIRRDVHVLGPTTEQVRWFLTASGETVGPEIVTPGEPPRIAAVITVATHHIAAHHYPVAFLQFLVIEFQLVAGLGCQFRYGAYILVAWNHRILDVDLFWCTTIQQAFALVGVLVRTADTRHFHFH